MVEDGKIILINILEEKTSKVTRIAKIQLETLGKMTSNYELNAKDIVIITLKLQKEQMKNDLKREKGVF